MAADSRDTWNPETRPRQRREVPAAWQSVLTGADAVEEVTDALRGLGIAGYVEFDAGTEATPDFGVRCGPVLTARYLPKKFPGNENRIGHDVISKAVSPGDIVVVDERDCIGSVIGGNSATKLKKAGVAALVVNGVGRDFDEVHANGLPAIATRWGLGSSKLTTELVSIGDAINFRGTAVAATDIAVVNRFGMALIPAGLAWDDLRRAMGRS